jgi:type I restriction enzyme S subunit
MKRYDSYKESGVQWIGEIPSHWTSIPIKFSTDGKQSSFIDGDWIESNVIESEGIRYLTTGNVGAGFYKEQGSGFISEKTFDELNCTEVYPGDLLISRLNEPIGRTCIVPDLGYRIVVAVDNVIYRPNKQLYDERYLMFQMNCKPYADNANFIARGSTMSRISRTTLGQIKVLVPPLKEQKAIAEWLDVKCGEIDKLIATQQRRIDLLQELRQSIITRAVTRGINPDATLRDSGIDWIGQIPTHWEIRKTSLIYNNIGSGTTPTSSNPDYYTENGDGFYWLQTGDLNDGDITSTSKQVTKLAVNECNLKFFPVDSVVIAMYGATIGKVGLLKIKTATNQACCVLPYSNIVVPKYSFFLYQAAKTPMLVEAIGGGQPNISQDIIKKLRVPLPPLAEQREIVAHIERETAKVDHALQQAELQIELLQELRQSVITEVVTGKRKVC